MGWGPEVGQAPRWLAGWLAAPVLLRTSHCGSGQASRPLAHTHTHPQDVWSSRTSSLAVPPPCPCRAVVLRFSTGLQHPPQKKTPSKSTTSDTHVEKSGGAPGRSGASPLQPHPAPQLVPEPKLPPQGGWRCRDTEVGRVSAEAAGLEVGEAAPPLRYAGMLSAWCAGGLSLHPPGQWQKPRSQALAPALPPPVSRWQTHPGLVAPQPWLPACLPRSIRRGGGWGGGLKAGSDASFATDALLGPRRELLAALLGGGRSPAHPPTPGPGASTPAKSAGGLSLSSSSSSSSPTCCHRAAAARTGRASGPCITHRCDGTTAPPSGQGTAVARERIARLNALGSRGPVSRGGGGVEREKPPTRVRHVSGNLSLVPRGPAASPWGIKPAYFPAVSGDVPLDQEGAGGQPNGGRQPSFGGPNPKTQPARWSEKRHCRRVGRSLQDCSCRAANVALPSPIPGSLAAQNAARSCAVRGQLRPIN